MEPYPAVDACATQFIEIVPLTRNTDDPLTKECDSGDLSAEVEQEILQQIKQEADDAPVCYILTRLVVLESGLKSFFVGLGLWL